MLLECQVTSLIVERLKQCFRLNLLLQSWHPKWAQITIPAAPFLSKLPVNGLGKHWRTHQVFGSLHPVGDLKKAPGPQLPAPGQLAPSSLAVVAICIVNQLMKAHTLSHIFISLSLFNLSFQIKKVQLLSKTGSFQTMLNYLQQVNT